MVEEKIKQIDEIDIRVTQWPARKAWKYKRKLGHLFAPLITEIAAGIEGGASDSITKNILDGDFDLTKLGSALEKLFEKLDDAEMDRLFLMFFEGNVRIGETSMTMEMFDQTFAGKMVTVYKMMGFVLEVNFGSFLGEGGIGTLLEKLK